MPADYETAKAQYSRLGHNVAFQCTLGGSELTYFDAVDAVGHYIELWENSEVFNDIAVVVEDAARDWDGSHPVRPAPG